MEMPEDKVFCDNCGMEIDPRRVTQLPCGHLLCRKCYAAEHANDPAPPVSFDPESTAADIAAACDELKTLLLRKNAAYGNSALDPVRLFSGADPVEQIKVRIDDKLSRISRGNGENDEDTLADLTGYLILLRVAMQRQKTGLKAEPTEPEDAPAKPSVTVVAPDCFGQHMGPSRACSACLHEMLCAEQKQRNASPPAMDAECERLAKWCELEAGCIAYTPTQQEHHAACYRIAHILRSMKPGKRHKITTWPFINNTEFPQWCASCDADPPYSSFLPFATRREAIGHAIERRCDELGIDIIEEGAGGANTDSSPKTS